MVKFLFLFRNSRLILQLSTLTTMINYRILRSFSFSFFIMLQGFVSAQLHMDSSFGNRGKQFINIADGGISTPLRFKVLKDGRTVCYLTNFLNGYQTLYLHRTKIKGEPDSSFGVNGFQSLDIKGERLGNYGLEIDDYGNCYVWGFIYSYQNHMTTGEFWFRRYDSVGNHDTLYNPLPMLQKSVAALLVMDCFTLGKNSKGYVHFTNQPTDKLVRLNMNGKIDSTWGKNGVVDSTLTWLKNIMEDETGQVHIFGNLVGHSNCAFMTLSPTAKKDLTRTYKGWFLLRCGTFTAVNQHNFAILRSEYNERTRQRFFEINLGRSMFTPEPSFGIHGITQVPVDYSLGLEPADFLKTKEGKYFLFWNRYDYEDDFERLIYKDYWSGLSMLDSFGKVITDFGKNGSSYLLDKGKSYYKIQNAQLLEDGSLLVFMNISNNGASSALLVKYKKPEMKSQKLSTKIPTIMDFRLYPNPAHKFINVQGIHLQRFSIADISGREKISGKLETNSDKQQIKLDLQQGIYLITIYNKFNQKKTQIISVN